MQGAQAQAELLKPAWDYLDAGQLLKHMLGLAYEQRGGQTTLLYLWFDPGTTDADKHQAEISSFGALVAGDRIAFRAMSYQELFRALAAGSGAERAPYISYLRERYFPTPV